MSLKLLPFKEIQKSNLLLSFEIQIDYYYIMSNILYIYSVTSMLLNNPWVLKNIMIQEFFQFIRQGDFLSDIVLLFFSFPQTN